MKMVAKEINGSKEKRITWNPEKETKIEALGRLAQIIGGAGGYWIHDGRNPENQIAFHEQTGDFLAEYEIEVIE